MECKKFREFFPEYIDRQLSPEANHIIRTHLLSCEGCQKEMAELEKTWTLLGELKEIEPSPDYVSGFYTKLASSHWWGEEILVFGGKIKDNKMFFPFVSSILVAAVVSCLIFAANLNNERMDQAIVLMDENDAQMIEDIGLAENFDVLEDLDLLSDYEVIEALDDLQPGSRT